jgi:hypothetical protein
MEGYMPDTFAFHLSQTDDGKHVACRDSEPLFCFVRDSEADAARLARDTIADYLRRFRDSIGLRPIFMSDP